MSANMLVKCYYSNGKYFQNIHTIKSLSCLDKRKNEFQKMQGKRFLVATISLTCLMFFSSNYEYI